MKRSRILAIIDGQETVVFGTIRDTGQLAYGGDPSDGIVEIREDGCEDDPIRIRWGDVLEVALAAA